MVDKGLDGHEQKGSSDSRRLQIRDRVCTPAEALPVVDDDRSTIHSSYHAVMTAPTTNVDRDQMAPDYHRYSIDRHPDKPLLFIGISSQELNRGNLTVNQ